MTTATVLFTIGVVLMIAAGLISFFTPAKSEEPPPPKREPLTPEAQYFDPDFMKIIKPVLDASEGRFQMKYAIDIYKKQHVLIWTWDDKAYCAIRHGVYPFKEGNLDIARMFVKAFFDDVLYEWKLHHVHSFTNYTDPHRDQQFERFEYETELLKNGYTPELLGKFMGKGAHVNPISKPEIKAEPSGLKVVSHWQDKNFYFNKTFN